MISDMNESLILQLAIVLPLLTSALIIATGKNPNVREGVTIVSALVLIYFVFNLYSAFSNDPNQADLQLSLAALDYFH